MPTAQDVSMLQIMLNELRSLFYLFHSSDEDFPLADKCIYSPQQFAGQSEKEFWSLQLVHSMFMLLKGFRYRSFPFF